MNGRRRAWLAGLTALAATLLLLFGSQAIWHTFAVAKPLDRAFAGVDGVQSVVRQQDEPVVLQVTLVHVANIQTTYTALEQQAKRILGTSAFRIVIRDNRTPELEQVYHGLHFQIQEAIATGRFSDMADRIRQKADAAAVDAVVYVDARHVYLQLNKGEAALYSVIPRMNEGAE